MTSSQDPRVEQRYAQAEQKNEARKTATVRRGPVSLIAVCLGVALAVGVVAAVDLRRLQTPRGTSLALVGAAVFGDCTTFRELSVERRPDAERDDEARCRALREATEAARDRPAGVEIEVLEVREGADRATALVRVGRPQATTREVELALEPRGGGYRVVLDEQTCEVLPCP